MSIDIGQPKNVSMTRKSSLAQPIVKSPLGNNFINGNKLEEGSSLNDAEQGDPIEPHGSSSGQGPTGTKIFSIQGSIKEVDESSQGHDQDLRQGQQDAVQPQPPQLEE
jgi:hypothetical protein